jgi:hypothetical protein
MPEKLTRRRLIAIAAAVALQTMALLIWRPHLPGPEKMLSGQFPEQIVYVRSNDDIVDAGAIFTLPKDAAKPIAIIWIHGWGVNFLPTDVRRDWPGAGGAWLYNNRCEYPHA